MVPARLRRAGTVAVLACGLLDLDGRARALELFLGLVGGLLVDLLEHRLGSAVDQVLGLLQAEARQRTHLLDHLDLLVAGAGEDHVELRLLLLAATLAARGSGARRRPGHHHRRRGGGLDVEGLLEGLDELRQLEERHLLELLEQIVAAHLGLGHGHSSPPGASAPGLSVASASCSFAISASAGSIVVSSVAVSASAVDSVCPAASASGADASASAPVSGASAGSFALKASRSRRN